MAVFHHVLWVALLSLVLSQVIKYITILHKEKTIKFKKHFWKFSFPSGHASFLTAMVFGVAFTEGFSSIAFTIAVVFYVSYLFDLMLFRKVFSHVKGVPKEAIGHDRRDLIGGMLLGLLASLLLLL